MFQAILNGNVQASLVTRPQLGGSYLDISGGVHRTNCMDYVLPGSG